jgi:hypothetical protein
VTPSRRLSVAGAAVLALAQAVLLARTAADKSDTPDEPVYIGAAALLWAHQDFTYNRAAPVLPKWGYALALRLTDPWTAGTPPEWHRVITHMLWNRRIERLRANLMAARGVTILVTVAGGLFLWAAARRFGEGAALLTHALWCFSPTVLASGALATLDGWVTAFLCLVLWAAVRLVEKPSRPRFAACGLAWGLALACKVTALGVAPVLAAVAFHALRREARAGVGRRFLFSMAVLGMAAAAVLWALYGFRFGWVGRLVLPFPDWWLGLRQQSELAAAGHRAYLFGQVSQGGWWWFYLAVLALKTTVGAQALAAARVASWLRARPARAALLVDAALLAFPLLLFALLSLGRTQTGVRYLLPAFPFVLAWLGRALPDLTRAFGRPGLAAAVVLAAAGAAESLAVHPHHLMFFNLWAGGPTNGPRYLVHGDDWGQDQRRLGEWIQRNSPDGVFYTYYTGLPEKWGIRYKQAPCEPRRGVYALHAVEVHRPRRMEEGCLDWLTVEPPDQRIGYSIYIYFVNKERMERLIAERGKIKPFARTGG